MENKNKEFPFVWLFRVEKKGRGWKVLDYISESGKFPSITGQKHMIPMKEHETISKIKKNFEDTPIFTCVFEYDTVSPSDIYQVVIEFRNYDDLDEYSNKTKGKDINQKGRQYHAEVSWIDEASEDFIEKLREE